MRMILQTEECGGFARYLPVRRLDGETRLKAEKRFLNCRMRGIILGCSFEDDVWTLTNELRRYTLDFRFDGTAFRRKAEAWIGCSEECYRECMKAYAAFHLGTYTLNYLQEIVGEMRLVAGMDKDEAEMLSGNERAPMFPMTGFLSLIPESNDLRDLVIEAWEEQKWRVRVSNPRPLADFALYLRFNKELDRFWDAASPEEKRFYFLVETDRHSSASGHGISGNAAKLPEQRRRQIPAFHPAHKTEKGRKKDFLHGGFRLPYPMV